MTSPTREERPLARMCKVAIALLLGLFSISLVNSSAFASLDATAFNVAPQTISSGTLSLIGNDNGAAFSSSVNLLVPGDITNRYVNYQNSGTLDGQNLTLSVADAGTSLLTSDGVKGLQVIVTACSVAWIASTGVCSGTATVRLASSSLLSLKTTPATLFAGSLTSGSWQYLQFSIIFPSTMETTVNGVLPSSTVQGLSASLTWTLREVQRASSVTNS